MYYVNDRTRLLCLVCFPARVRTRTETPSDSTGPASASHTPNPPTNIVPTNIARLKLSGKSPMDMRSPPL